MKELYIKADELGFIPENLSIGWKENPYLWLCELQKWLREKHEQDVFVVKSGNNYYTVNNSAKLTLSTIADLMENLNWKYYKTYEEALEIGLQEALKLM